ncbi:unnamed protein product [Amoebophrya sp. A120]|nr:unnamed protein product [Amoebophrya sp. A120]|eukprot:GSA120T00024552001.1
MGGDDIQLDQGASTFNLELAGRSYSTTQSSQSRPVSASSSARPSRPQSANRSRPQSATGGGAGGNIKQGANSTVVSANGIVPPPLPGKSVGARVGAATSTSGAGANYSGMLQQTVPPPATAPNYIGTAGGSAAFAPKYSSGLSKQAELRKQRHSSMHDLEDQEVQGLTLGGYSTNAHASLSLDPCGISTPGLAAANQTTVVNPVVGGDQQNAEHLPSSFASFYLRGELQRKRRVVVSPTKNRFRYTRRMDLNAQDALAEQNEINARLEDRKSLMLDDDVDPASLSPDQVRKLHLFNHQKKGGVFVGGNNSRRRGGSNSNSPQKPPSFVVLSSSSTGSSSPSKQGAPTSQQRGPANRHDVAPQQLQAQNLNLPREAGGGASASATPITTNPLFEVYEKLELMQHQADLDETSHADLQENYIGCSVDDENYALSNNINAQEHQSASKTDVESVPLECSRHGPPPTRERSREELSKEGEQDEDNYNYNYSGGSVSNSNHLPSKLDAKTSTTDLINFQNSSRSKLVVDQATSVDINQMKSSCQSASSRPGVHSTASRVVQQIGGGPFDEQTPGRQAGSKTQGSSSSSENKSSRRLEPAGAAEGVDHGAEVTAEQLLEKELQSEELRAVCGPGGHDDDDTNKSNRHLQLVQELTPDTLPNFLEKIQLLYSFEPRYEIFQTELLSHTTQLAADPVKRVEKQLELVTTYLEYLAVNHMLSSCFSVVISRKTVSEQLARHKNWREVVGDFDEDGLSSNNWLHNWSQSTSTMFSISRNNSRPGSAHRAKNTRPSSATTKPKQLQELLLQEQQAQELDAAPVQEITSPTLEQEELVVRSGSNNWLDLMAMSQLASRVQPDAMPVTTAKLGVTDDEKELAFAREEAERARKEAELQAQEGSAVGSADVEAARQQENAPVAGNEISAAPEAEQPQQQQQDALEQHEQRQKSRLQEEDVEQQRLENNNPHNQPDLPIVEVKRVFFDERKFADQLPLVRFFTGQLKAQEDFVVQMKLPEELVQENEKLKEENHFLQQKAEETETQIRNKIVEENVDLYINIQKETEEVVKQSEFDLKIAEGDAEAFLREKNKMKEKLKEVLDEKQKFDKVNERLILSAMRQCNQLDGQLSSFVTTTTTTQASAPAVSDEDHGAEQPEKKPDFMQFLELQKQNRANGLLPISAASSSLQPLFLATYARGLKETIGELAKNYQESRVKAAKEQTAAKKKPHSAAGASQKSSSSSSSSTSVKNSLSGSCTTSATAINKTPGGRAPASTSSSSSAANKPKSKITPDGPHEAIKKMNTIARPKLKPKWNKEENTSVQREERLWDCLAQVQKVSEEAMKDFDRDVVEMDALLMSSPRPASVWTGGCNNSRASSAGVPSRPMSAQTNLYNNNSSSSTCSRPLSAQTHLSNFYAATGGGNSNSRPQSAQTHHSTTAAPLSTTSRPVSAMDHPASRPLSASRPTHQLLMSEIKKNPQFFLNQFQEDLEAVGSDEEVVAETNQVETAINQNLMSNPNIITRVSVAESRHVGTTNHRSSSFTQQVEKASSSSTVAHHLPFENVESGGSSIEVNGDRDDHDVDVDDPADSMVNKFGSSSVSAGSQIKPNSQVLNAIPHFIQRPTSAKLRAAASRLERAAEQAEDEKFDFPLNSSKPGQLSFTPDYVKKKENHWTRQGWKTTFASKVNKGVTFPSTPAVQKLTSEEQERALQNGLQNSTTSSKKAAVSSSKSRKVLLSLKAAEAHNLILARMQQKDKLAREFESSPRRKFNRGSPRKSSPLFKKKTAITEVPGQRAALQGEQGEQQAAADHIPPDAMNVVPPASHVVVVPNVNAFLDTLKSAKTEQEQLKLATDEDHHVLLVDTDVGSCTTDAEGGTATGGIISSASASASASGATTPTSTIGYNIKNTGSYAVAGPGGVAHDHVNMHIFGKQYSARTTDHAGSEAAPGGNKDILVQQIHPDYRPVTTSSLNQKLQQEVDGGKSQSYEERVVVDDDVAEDGVNARNVFLTV